MLKAPVNSPLPPIPWTALPKMSIFEDEAMPAAKDPTMNIAWNVKKEYYYASALTFPMSLGLIDLNFVP